MPRLLRVGLISMGVGFGRRPFLLQERQDKDGRFVFSQRCFPGWLGPGAPSYVPQYRWCRGRYPLMFLDSTRKYPGAWGMFERLILQ